MWVSFSFSKGNVSEDGVRLISVLLSISLLGFYHYNPYTWHGQLRRGMASPGHARVENSSPDGGEEIGSSRDIHPKDFPLTVLLLQLGPTPQSFQNL